jgi:hypothetical protein
VTTAQKEKNHVLHRPDCNGLEGQKLLDVSNFSFFPRFCPWNLQTLEPFPCFDPARKIIKRQRKRTAKNLVDDREGTSHRIFLVNKCKPA